MCETTTLKPGQVIDVICQFYELDVDRLIKRIPETGRHFRTTPYVKGRQFFAYWMRKNTKFSLKEIGALMEGVDHSTILHSVDQVIDDMALYAKYKSEIFALNQLIQEKEAELESIYV